MAASPQNDDDFLPVLEEIDSDSNSVAAHSTPDTHLLSSSPLESVSEWPEGEFAVDSTSFFDGDVDMSDIMGTLECSDEGCSSLIYEINSQDKPGSLIEESVGTIKETDKKPTRKRRKHEVDRLRSEISILETKLHSLKSQSCSNDMKRNSDGNDTSKQISVQMCVEKQRALSENERLRHILQEQLKLAKSVQRSLNRMTGLKEFCTLPLQQRLDKVNPCSKEIFGNLFDCIASSYLETDTMFQRAEVPDPRQNTRNLNMQLKNDGNQSVLRIQVVESKLLPFSFAFISNAAWRYLSSENDERKRTGFHLIFEDLGDDMVGVCKLDSSASLMEVAGHVAIRRYIEQNRIIFVWGMLGSAQSHVTQNRFQDIGWAVFEPSQDDPLHSTIIRACLQCTPLSITNETETNFKEVGVTMELVLAGYEKTVGYIYQAVTDMLLKEFLGALPT